jgi:hypothetical protein
MSCGSPDNCDVTGAAAGTGGNQVATLVVEHAGRRSPATIATSLVPLSTIANATKSW